MKAKEIVMIKIENIYPHPGNPRKDLGDLTELTESIKKSGVMQNLTVIPMVLVDPDATIGKNEECYTVLIGHRRLAASKAAGIKELPCRIIEEMSEREQVSIMLEENMQRNDLTIYEQAQGFQMMLDLGETEDSIAEKTGFSKTTIRHRLNIAKLNQKELQKKEQDENFRLSLKDLYELEKVKDVKTRNKILKEASSSRDLVSRAQSAVSEAKRKENADAIIRILKKLGVEAAPEEYEKTMWSGNWKTVQEFELEKDAPKEINLPESKNPLYYYIYYRSLEIVTKGKEQKRELSQYELEEKERNKTKKQIKAILKESTARRTEFIRNIISGKVDPVKNEIHEIQKIWVALVELGAYASGQETKSFFLDKDWYSCTDEERQEAAKKAEGLSTIHQMLITLNKAMANTNEPFDYKLHFIKEKGNALKKGYEALEPYGWYFESEDESKVLDGTHELYTKEQEAADAGNQDA